MLRHMESEPGLGGYINSLTSDGYPREGDHRAGFVKRGISHVKGSNHPPLWHWTVPQAFRRAAAEWGQRPALVMPLAGLSLTWQELDAETDIVALGLLALGIRKGDRIGIWSPNCMEWVLVQFATAKIGAVLVNINPAYRVQELEFALRKVGCKALILSKRFKSSDYIGMVRSLSETADPDTGAIASRRLPSLEIAAVIGGSRSDGLMPFDAIPALGRAGSRRDLDAVEDSLDPDDPINIQFTSGTTGSPKGATLTHRNIVNNARFVTDRILLSEEDRLCLPVPLYHCFGMAMGTLGCVTKGAAIVLCGEAFDARRTLEALAQARCTALYAVPTMFLDMLDLVESGGFDLSALRTGIMAGAPCPIEAMRRVIDEMNLREITICYGMTETAPVSFQSHVDDAIENRCSTVGRIHPHVEVKLIGSDGGTVPVGRPGELCTRGYSVMSGYWGDDDMTRDSIRDGWMHTGDQGVLDESGYCRIVGRLKEMIIRGGENVFPKEIEDFLFRHPDVKAAQVFGVPDRRLGEIVCAWVIARKGASLSPDSLRRFCEGNIAHYKIPARFRIVDEWPMTVTGKPQKFKMREQMEELLARGG